MSIISAHSVQAQYWSSISDFPGTQRDDGTGFTIDNFAYCGTGNLPWGVGSADFYKLNMDDDTWSSVASLPAGEERQYACGFASSSHGFIFGGYNDGNFFNDLWQYDPVSNSWTEKSPMPASGRSASAHFVIGDTAYIVCGKTSSEYAIDEVWAYNMITDTWWQKNNFPYGNRWRSCAASSASTGYMIFGKDELLNYPNELYSYDPITDVWTSLNTFPGSGRSHAKAVFFDNNFIILTGYDSLLNSYNDMWRFDITDNSWHQLNSIPATGRRAGMCFASSTALYYTTGINSANVRLKESWKVINPASVFEYFEEPDIVLFPNPATDFFTLKFDSDIGDVFIQITDITGNTVYSGLAENSKQILVDELKSGSYLVQIFFSDKIITRKLLLINE